VAKGSKPTRDDQIAMHIASGKSAVKTAELLGLHERSVRKRLSRPEVAAKVREFRAEAINRAMFLLGNSMTGAGAVLVKLAKRGRDRVRLQAAKALLDAAFKAHHAVDLEQQIAELSAKVDKLTGVRR
jgi:hypothetical protein